MSVNNLNETPNANRVHIAIFGKRNSGKSSIINALTNQQTSLVSDVEGTTTDPVYKAMELYPIGACVFIDTAGFDDIGELGQMRVKKSKQVLEKTDIAIMVIDPSDTDYSYEQKWEAEIKALNKNLLFVVNKSDVCDTVPEYVKDKNYVSCSALTLKGISELKEAISKINPAGFEFDTITGHLVGEGDHVLLVAPQDIQAPKGRLILPQVQVIRDLLDLKAIVSVVTTDKLVESLTLYKNPPKLIITDSQVFKFVHEHCPKESKLTSFSVLLARYKGDIDEFVTGVKALHTLKETDRVLILEACTHNPLDGDIGRIKIPTMLRKKVGENIQIDVRSGNNIPDDLTPYSLVIHCGGCMFNRAYVLSRIAKCKNAGVPITNYGVFIAEFSGILGDVTY